MAAVKTWARSVFILSVFSSTALLLVPRSMNKQAKFVVEMLILLCVIAPLTGLFPGAVEALMPDGYPGEAPAGSSLESFLASETSRRVKEIASQAGVPIKEVVTTVQKGGFALAEVKVWLAQEISWETESQFASTLAAFLGVSEVAVTVVQPD